MTVPFGCSEGPMASEAHRSSGYNFLSSLLESIRVVTPDDVDAPEGRQRA